MESGKIKNFTGELIGTFVLVFFGCGSVAVSVLFGAFSSLFEVAFIWGLAVIFGIFAARSFSDAHLNPAVSVAMLIAKRMSKKSFLPYVLGQFSGAFLAALLLYFLMSPAISVYELEHGIVRGEANSIATACMFGEFYSNPGFAKMVAIEEWQACFAEALGTFILVFMIFALTTERFQQADLQPLYIGFTVTIIICIIAPFTQAGLNPARDFAPRIVAYLMGWKGAAFPKDSSGFFTVYILSPIVGAIIAERSWSFVKKISLKIE